MTIKRALPTLTLLACVSFFLATSAQAADRTDEQYQIQPGDVLNISVWNEENLKLEVLVRPDGGLSYPLAGDIQASGKSVAELQNEVADKLKRFIPEPSVTVAVKQLAGNKVYVIGKVNRPGEFMATRPVDVMQALSMAGGMTPYAAANKIRILRREGKRQTAISFAYGEIEKGENLEQNIVLHAGDVVVVP